MKRYVYAISMGLLAGALVMSLIRPSLPVARAAIPVHINSEGLKLNPGALAVLADTGPLNEGCYWFRAQWMSNVIATVQLEQRNAANTATIGPAITQAAAGVAIYYGVAANVTYDFTTDLINLCVAQDERIRILNTNNIPAGAAQATIMVQ